MVEITTKNNNYQSSPTQNVKIDVFSRQVPVFTNHPVRNNRTGEDSLNKQYGAKYNSISNHLFKFLKPQEQTIIWSAGKNKYKKKIIQGRNF